VVDHERLMVELLLRSLSQRGFRVRGARNVPAAKACMRWTTAMGRACRSRSRRGRLAAA